MRRSVPWLLWLGVALCCCRAGDDDGVARSAVRGATAEQVAGRSARSVVVVEVDDPLALHRFDPLARAEAMTTPGQREQRAEDLAARKGRVLASLRQRSGRPFRVVHRYPDLAAVALEVDADQAALLRSTDGVAGVEAGRDADADVASSVPFTGAPTLHGGGDEGAGTYVVVIDAAVRYWDGAFGSCPAKGAWADHTPGCAIAIWRNFNAYPDPPDDDDRNDPLVIAENEYHGTLSAGIIHAMAPEAKIIALNTNYFNVTRDLYTNHTYDITEALQWVLANASQFDRIVAVNISAGNPREDARYCNSGANYDALRTLWVDHGILVSASTGNEAKSDWVKTPACTMPALASAAQHDSQLGDFDQPICTQLAPHAGEIACFSNLNGLVDLVAPGRWISAAGWGGTGTSEAAPHVAGAVALLQSHWNRTEGAFRNAYWARMGLMIRAAPLAYDGAAFRQLDVDAPAPHQLARNFPGYLREEPAALIPAQPAELQQQLTVSGQGWNVASAYLYLEAAHLEPENLRARLVAPSGDEVSFALTGGTSNFNAVVGKEVHPGIFAALAGNPVDGTWRLELSDAGDEARGHYLAATLFFVRQGSCTPSCAVDGCADDGCGGACGSCTGSAFCSSVTRQCTACTPDCGTRTCGDDRCGGSCGPCDDGVLCNGIEACVEGVCLSGTPPTGAPCDDGDPCTADDVCVAGSCAGSTYSCDDDDDCTDDICKGDGTCDHPNNTASCDDSNACTTGDVCAAGSCAGNPYSCDDDDDCTDDICKGDGTCDHPNNTASCDDSDPCTTGDVCAAGSCVPGPNTCPDAGSTPDASTPDDAASGTDAQSGIDGGAPDGGAPAGDLAVPDGTPADGTPADGSIRDLAPAPDQGVDAIAIDGSPPDAASSDDGSDGGCGCRTVGTGPFPWPLLLWLPLVRLGRGRGRRETRG